MRFEIFMAICSHLYSWARTFGKQIDSFIMTSGEMICFVISVYCSHGLFIFFFLIVNDDLSVNLKALNYSVYCELCYASNFWPLKHRIKVHFYGRGIYVSDKLVLDGNIIYIFCRADSTIDSGNISLGVKLMLKCTITNKYAVLMWIVISNVWLILELVRKKINYLAKRINVIFTYLCYND